VDCSVLTAPTHGSLANDAKCAKQDVEIISKKYWQDMKKFS